MTSTAQRRSGRKRKLSPLGRLITFGGVVLILFLGVTVFFRVDTIRIDGDTRYTLEEVTAVAGVERGAHMLFLDPYAIKANIQAGLPYAGQVTLRRQFPSRLEVTITDTEAIAAVPGPGGYWLLSRDAKLLEHLETRPVQPVIRVRGIGETTNPAVGEMLYLGEEREYELRYLRDILSALDILGIAAGVSELDLSDLHNPQLLYDKRLEVQLGPNRNLQGKMNMLAGILDHLEYDENGTIDLNPEQPVFRAHDL